MTAPALSVPTANGRFYRDPNGRRDMVPSITNVIGMLDKPALKFWAAKEAANYAADNREMLAGLPRDAAQQLVRNAPFQRSDDSPAAIGDIVHNWIDRHVQGDAPTHDEVVNSHRTARDMWYSFIKFRDHYAPDFIDSEFTVWSDQYDYAGTADLHLVINGVSVLADTKTGANVYSESAMQLAAIANADIKMSTTGEELPVPKFERYAILHIRPRSATLVPVENIDAAWACFRALREVFKWKVQYADQTLGFAPKVN